MCLSKCFAVYSCFVYGWNVIVVSNQGSNPLGLVRNAPNLRGIPDNLPAFDTWQIYSLSPRPENSNRRFCGGFFVFCSVRPDSNGKLKFTRVRMFPRVRVCRTNLWAIPDVFVAYCLQNLVVPTMK